MDGTTIVIGAVIVVALGLLLWLPARKHWNAGGEVDSARETLEAKDEEEQ